MEQHGDVEAAEMEDLLARRIGEHRDEVRRLLLAGGDADHIGSPVAGRELHDAKAVATRDQAERFRIDRDRARIAGGVGLGNVALVEPYCIRHRKSPDRYLHVSLRTAQEAC